MRLRYYISSDGGNWSVLKIVSLNKSSLFPGSVKITGNRSVSKTVVQRFDSFHSCLSDKLTKNPIGRKIIRGRYFMLSKINYTNVVLKEPGYG